MHLFLFTIVISIKMLVAAQGRVPGFPTDLAQNFVAASSATTSSAPTTEVAISVATHVATTTSSSVTTIGGIDVDLLMLLL
jgi:hypothetical protein